MKKLLSIISILFVAIHLFGQSANIGQRTYNFKDEKRGRPLVTELWYPTTDTPKQADKKFSPFTRNYTVRDGALPVKRLPLILLSHGTGGGRLTLEWLAQALVQNGFMVAAVDHWGNTFDNRIPAQFLSAWERPQDLSFILTQLLNDPLLQKAIDKQRIGATGFSVGGYTVLALAGAEADFLGAITYYKTIGKKEIDFPEFPGLAYLLDDPKFIESSKHVPDLKDDRIKAVFAICPGAGPTFTSEKQFHRITAPVFIVGANSDRMAPVMTNARHFKSLMPKARYYEFPGMVGHYVMLNEAINEVKKSDPVYFVDDPSVNRHQVHLKVDSMEVDFFKKNLK